ncbi:MAG: hypothetical protein MUF31_03875 [Akkermansiaceae bacterium]|jgi:chromosome segregation ATPase|nr:hypothetical protein [Akkermansiaceae bacterium]
MPTSTESSHTHHLRIRDEQLEIPTQRSQTPDDVDGRLRMAQTQLEELQARREELERLKQETERLNFRRRELISSQVEMTERLTTALTMIDREVFEMRQQIEDLEQCRTCFAGHLNKIGKIQPESWSREQLSAHLDRSLALVEHAEDEYSQAAEHFSRTRSAGIFAGVRGGKVRRGEFRQQFMRGLAFNLPVIVLGGAALVLLLFR